MLECEENTPTFDVEPKKATFSFAFPEEGNQTNVILSASEISHDLSEKSICLAVRRWDSSLSFRMTCKKKVRHIERKRNRLNVKCNGQGITLAANHGRWFLPPRFPRKKIRITIQVIRILVDRGGVRKASLSATGI